jgi:hypothetical protein
LDVAGHGATDPHCFFDVMNRFHRKRSLMELAFAVICLLTSLRFFLKAHAAASASTNFIVAYRGSVGPATPAQGYLLSVAFLLTGLTCAGLYILSGNKETGHHNADKT